MFGLIKTRNGFIALAVVGLGYYAAINSLSDSSKDDLAVGEQAALVSGPLQMVVDNIEEVGDGVIIYVTITNISEKTVSAATGTLVAKDVHKRRLLSEEMQLITDRVTGLPPGQSDQKEFFFFEQYQDEIEFFAFRASFVDYADPS